MTGTASTTVGTPEPLVYRLPAAGVVLGGISRRKVHDLIAAGELKTVNVGHIRMVTRASIEAYVTRQMKVGAA